MSNLDTSRIEVFLSVIDRSPGFWQSLDIRAVAAKLEGRWHNVVSRCLLRREAPREAVRIQTLPITEWMGAWQRVLPVDELGSLMEKVEEGYLRFGRHRIAYQGGILTAEREPRSYRFDDHHLNDISWEHSRGEWSERCISAGGEQAWSIVRALPVRKEDLDEVIRDLPTPYDGVGGLIRATLGLRDPLGDTHSSYFSVVAPVEARLRVEECRLAESRLWLRVEAGSEVVARSCSVGVFGERSGREPLSASMALGKAEWEREGDLLSLSEEWVLNDAPAQVEVFLRAGGHVVHRIPLRDCRRSGADVRVRIFDAVDLGLEGLGKRLRDRDVFESAVGQLLGLVGFEVDLMGGTKGLQDAVDVVATDRVSRVVLAVECTTGSPDSKGKLDKLVKRSRMMQEMAGGFQVVPVLATPDREDKVSRGVLNRAAEDRISLLCEEDLERMREMALQGESVSGVVEYVKKRVVRHGDAW